MVWKLEGPAVLRRLVDSPKNQRLIQIDVADVVIEMEIAGMAAAPQVSCFRRILRQSRVGGKTATFAPVWMCPQVNVHLGELEDWDFLRKNNAFCITGRSGFLKHFLQNANIDCLPEPGDEDSNSAKIGVFFFINDNRSRNCARITFVSSLDR